MSDNTYTPPKVWTWDPNNGGKFANINRPTAGAQFEKELPVGDHPFIKTESVCPFPQFNVI